MWVVWILRACVRKKGEGERRKQCASATTHRLDLSQETGKRKRKEQRERDAPRQCEEEESVCVCVSFY